MCSRRFAGSGRCEIDGRAPWRLQAAHGNVSRLDLDPAIMSSAPNCALPALDHPFFLRRAFAVARQARANGNHPFGAVLVSSDRQELLSCKNGYWPDRDMTGHAERLLATLASRTLDPDALARCSLYSSAEPCAMCAGAIYWVGIGRVVYGQSEAALRQATGAHPENPTLALPCRN